MVKVSLLMCIYNGEIHLREAIESILQQTFKDFELILVDDGSTDSTPQILSEYAAKDSRIVLMRNEENLGLEQSLNKGLSVAKGEYFARQDADDVSLSNRLEQQIDFLDAHPAVGALGTAVELINERGICLGVDYLPTDHESLQALLLVNNFMHHSTLMVRHHLMQELGGYDESMRHAEDYDLWWRLSCISRLATLPNVLLCRRLDNSPRISKLYRERQLKNSFKISLRAIEESLADHASNLDDEFYQKFWWAYLRLLDKESYQRFWWGQHGQQGQLSWGDIPRLKPVWNLFATHPGGTSVWGPRLLALTHDLLRRRQTVVGFQLLWIATRKLKATFQWLSITKSLVKPYLPASTYKVWRFWQLQQKSN